MRALLATCAIVLICAGTASAVSGTAGFGLGIATPRGQANRYTESSFTLKFSGSMDLPGTPGIRVRATGAGVFLESHDHDLNVGGWDLFTEKYSSDLYRFTLGAEFAPPLRAFEPYVGSGVGVYYFKNGVTLVDHDDEEIDSKTLSSEASPGWYLTGGVRLYVRPKIALDVGVQYDKIKNMKHLKAKDIDGMAGLGTESVDSEYVTVYVGGQFRWP